MKPKIASLPRPRLGAIGTAVPRHILPQAAVAARAEAVFGSRFADFTRFALIYRHAAVETRRSCVPLEWYLKPRSLAERNRLYIENALILLEEAARMALDKAGLDFSAIDGLVVVSSSGIATPSLDARLIERMNLRRDLERLPIFGLGCAGGVLGLARAAQMARAAPEKRYLFLVVELCGLTFRPGDGSKSNVIATALFGDGAAATIVSCVEDGPAITGWGERMAPDSLDVMGWDIVDDGFKVIFSRDIPSLVRRDMRASVDVFLGRNGLTRGEIDRFVCHPGGAKVLDALEEAFEIGPGALAQARDVLRRFGNMSAATVIFVLDQVLRETPGKRYLVSSFGPGFTTALLLLETA